MKAAILSFILAVFLLAGSCRDSSKNLVINQQLVGKIHSVAILGNSLVRHGPSDELGWSGDWGMAASSVDNDFVHLLIKAIHERDTSVKVQFENIASFEHNFQAFDYSSLDRMKNSDMIVLKISENVKLKDGEEDELIKSIDSLLNYLDPDHRAVRVICDGFWNFNDVNDILEDYAYERGYPFLVTSDLSKDESNQAIGLFANVDVADHPNDKGMMMIKERIWAYIGKYFPG